MPYNSGGDMLLSEEQAANYQWWQQNPMTYDWQETLKVESGSREWFEEIDRRFLSASYFARGADGTPFGRFLKKEYVAGKDVLEVGCGMGTHAAMLAGAGARLKAVDLTERAVEVTRRRLEMSGLRGSVERADAEHLPFADNSFDFVWSWGVIHHSHSMETCLAEITRVLRPGGRLGLMVYYRPSLVYYVYAGLVRGVLMGKLLRQSVHQIYIEASDGFYARVFNRKELTALLAEDYEKVSATVVGLKAELFPIPRWQMKENLEGLTPDWLASAILSRWGSMIVAEAVKKG